MYDALGKQALLNQVAIEPPECLDNREALWLSKGGSLTFCLRVLEKIPFVFRQEVEHFPAFDYILPRFIAGLVAFAPTPLLPQALTVDQCSPFTTN